MLFMVIEKYKDDNSKAVYARAKEKGRMMPEGLNYIDSWVSADLSGCFQLMETQDMSLFQQWILQWQDLVDFEIVPVVTSKETFEKVMYAV